MDPAKLKVVELRAALAERGLDTKGNKPVLVERLRKALEEESQQHVEENTPVRMEIIGDTASEGVLEAARSSQPPKTPSRPSRSSTMTTPTKVSTRNTSRMATTPNSSKQFSPSKTQYLEKAHEAMMTISESTSEEFVVQEEISKYSPEKYRGERTDHAVSIIQNETHALPSEESREADATCVRVLEDDRCEANPFQVPATEPSEKSSTIECVDHSSRIRDKYEMKKSSVDDINELQQSSARPAFIDVTRDFTKPKENIEIKEDTDIEVRDTFEKDIKDEIVTSENVEYIEDSYNVKDNVDIPEQPTHVIPDQVDRAYNIDLKEKIIDDKYAMQEENMDISVNTGDVNEKTDAPQDEQVVEMEKVKEEMEADESNLDCKDKKRKRSSSPVIPVSPVETQRSQESPVSLILEDEPNLDESAVILSWYDSDLNLIIDKEGFLSATPMDNEDLHHMWAGVRASYGFANGKVYYETKIKEYHSITMQEEEQLHKFRVGWSVSNASMQLGEEKFSYAYTNSGKKGTDKEFTDYGLQFNKDDIVGCYLDMTPENTVELSYTLNGKELGSAFSISKEELGDRPLFPHILTKNCTFACNFGQEDTWCEQIPGYIPADNVEPKNKVAGPRRASKKSDCEVIMMCGLPGAGKTSWARKYAAEHPDKLYNILGCDNLFEKMEDVILHKGKNQTRQAIMNKCNRAFERLMEIAAGRRRNYILDQRSNVYHCHQRRKMRPFCGYQRRAVVIMPTDEEYNQRLSTYDVKKSSLDSSVLEMKAIFSAPSVGEWFDIVEWIGLDEEQGAKLIEKYNKEYTEVNQQSPTKQPRLDKIESNKETRDSRNNRDIRDYRDRRNSYQDRGRNSPWRGNMGGWRGERPQRGGYMRHSGGYGPSHPVPWRMRGRGGPVMRGMDRRGGIDRRPVNDRNRPGTVRQGGWAPMSNYQGTQQSGWSQQDNWSGSQSGWSQQSSGWGQQGSWGGGNWKGYQGTYGQAGYSQQQQGYGNSNWNNWNQQYYNNQYWSQQQQSGQTTAAGGQAEIANETTDTGAEYNYSQGWQNFSQGRTTTPQSAATSATQQSHLHK